MQRLTVTGRLLITVLILAAIYFGFKYVGGVDLLKSLQKNQTEQVEHRSESGETSASAEGSASEESSTSSNSDAAVSSKRSFDYEAPQPTGGTLKGVVELGASGFNSFIVRIDANKNWKLEKSEFGNSLVIENMAMDEDVRAGLKKYIGGMLDYGVSSRDIHFVVSSGAVKADVTQKIIRALKSLNYFVNTVTPEEEGRLALRSVLPADFYSSAFVVDIGSGNTKISWKTDNKTTALESYGSKYFQEGKNDEQVYSEVKAKAKQVPSAQRKTCFIIGGVPFELAKAVRKGKERYTVLDAPDAYKMENAKTKAGINIYKAIADATGCEQFVFDWDANFTIGFLLDLPK
ncbi:hypothetical protein [Siphonobacter sp. SORGH_AS_1065]|uniref:hypothetical protein n=1 Tax=Siphonobacter sp. SORGH_AS_1065 TaxID=3041795 RepID=UPI002784689A|nr:hypothetical protein [Siphonobacter sp. SORGH_AS_1065]MDQ1088784.1 hypothetical protein [Siphonobacter sp. SORGH_AS_1065]